MDLNDLRREYSGKPLDVDSMDRCPFKQFEAWFKQATDGDVLEANAMILSTVSPDGIPTQRTVLLKCFDESGFVFFTNYKSRKAQQISQNSRVSILFPWYELQRQVEINGVAQKVSVMESLTYFALRPRGSQLGAWVSEQNSVVSQRSVLLAKLAEVKHQFASGAIPKPPSWGGFRIVPNRFEFWQGGENRLHDRIEYTVHKVDRSWVCRRLAP
jgi:pyridoxamine 5'-phosphate oxidase